MPTRGVIKGETSAGSDHQSKVSTLNTSSDYGVAVKELKFSDYKKEALSFTVYPYCGCLM